MNDPWQALPSGLVIPAGPRSKASDEASPDPWPALLARIDEYDCDANGGPNLHIVLADDNYEDHHVRYCLDQCIREGDAEGESICRGLLAIPEEARMDLLWGRNYPGTARPDFSTSGQFVYPVVDGEGRLIAVFSTAATASEAIRGDWPDRSCRVVRCYVDSTSVDHPVIPMP